MNCITSFQDDVVVSKGVNGNARSFRAHLFLLDQQLVITQQQNKQKTFQYIDAIAVSDCRVICIGGWLCAHTSSSRLALIRA